MCCCYTSSTASGPPSFSTLRKTTFCYATTLCVVYLKGEGFTITQYTYYYNIYIYFFQAIYYLKNFLSRLLYCIASAICTELIFSAPSRSAIVRATFKIRPCARALKPRLSKADFKIAFSSLPNRQNASSPLVLNSEFE